MTSKQRVQEAIGRLKVIVGLHLRNLTSYLLFLWIIARKSKPLALSQKSAIVFAPHQDDETLGCGGAIALKRQQGVPVKVVFMTDGRYGFLDRMETAEVISLRKKEARTALDALGVADSEIIFLDRIDGTLASLTSESRQNLVEQIVQLLQKTAPGEVYVPHRKDFHADHEATYDLVQTAIAQSGMQLELLQYPIWIFWQNPLSFQLQWRDLDGAYRLPINSVRDRKHQAIETYQSQIPGLSRGFLRRFFSPYELFFKE
ncbi:GlcNAc-PI de-N-acetylase [cyanobacterium TDX16]|nr:GlcNAc-PI de-N-acetylase [cyanobacterium TDX16]